MCTDWPILKLWDPAGVVVCFCKNEPYLEPVCHLRILWQVRKDEVCWSLNTSLQAEVIIALHCGTKVPMRYCWAADKWEVMLLLPWLCFLGITASWGCFWSVLGLSLQCSSVGFSSFEWGGIANGISRTYHRKKKKRLLPKSSLWKMKSGSRSLLCSRSLYHHIGQSGNYPLGHWMCGELQWLSVYFLSTSVIGKM